MINGVCDSCAGVRRTSEPKTHHCAGEGCMCGSCNSLPVVLYSANGLASLVSMSRRGIASALVFPLLCLMAVLYTMVPTSLLGWSMLTGAMGSYSYGLFQNVRGKVFGRLH